PQYKYPTPLIQMNQATQFIKENKMNLPIDFTQVIIGGDSAGAQLASQFTAIQTNDRLREAMKFDKSFKPSQIKGAILFGGFYNMQTVIIGLTLVIFCLLPTIHKMRDSQ
ncbi:alpha/beta hydrolase, partial [Staphylococcus aureus]|uniref:alpha/beta hydrolase n=1 Tax=Staphylococcus aureus TaxID=1280 RepID=UPI00210CE6A7